MIMAAGPEDCGFLNGVKILAPVADIYTGTVRTESGATIDHIMNSGEVVPTTGFEPVNPYGNGS